MSNKNENPSVYNLIYWLIQDKKIEAVDLFKFLEFFWPSFTQKEGHVFLKEKFSEEVYFEAIKMNKNPEYWVNLFTIDDYFNEIPNQEKYAADLAKTLVQIWQAKLKIDFPSKAFTVEYLHDKDYGDFGLTFYQTRKKKS